MGREVARSAAAWRIAFALSIVTAGLALGDERPREPSQYFWDLSSYVIALDSVNPYKSDAALPFLYPPTSVEIFKLARSHLFEFMSVASVAAIAAFGMVVARLDIAFRFEWLLAITAMGGLGVVSLKTGNVAIPMNFTVLALLIDAAAGAVVSRNALPAAIVIGSLIKPQFALYLGLLPILERSRRSAIAKMLVAALVIAGIYAISAAARPDAWRDYVAAVADRTLAVKDFGWDAAALFMHVADSTAAALAGYVLTFLCVSALAFAARRRSASSPPLLSVACLMFVVLTFANPRVPLYDLHAAGLALAVCCAVAGASAWILVSALAIGLVPWSILEFAQTPTAWPWWTLDHLIAHLAGIVLLLSSLSIHGLTRRLRNPVTKIG